MVDTREVGQTHSGSLPDALTSSYAPSSAKVISLRSTGWMLTAPATLDQSPYHFDKAGLAPEPVRDPGSPSTSLRSSI